MEGKEEGLACSAWHGRARGRGRGSCSKEEEEESPTHAHTHACTHCGRREAEGRQEEDGDVDVVGAACWVLRWEAGRQGQGECVSSCALPRRKRASRRKTFGRHFGQGKRGKEGEGQSLLALPYPVRDLSTCHPPTHSPPPPHTPVRMDPSLPPPPPPSRDLPFQPPPPPSQAARVPNFILSSPPSSARPLKWSDSSSSIRGGASARPPFQGARTRLFE